MIFRQRENLSLTSGRRFCANFSGECHGNPKRSDALKRRCVKLRNLPARELLSSEVKEAAIL
jgi:hypothetical protein